MAALAVAKVVPTQLIANPTTTNIVRIAAQTAANDASFVAERSLLASVAPWLAKGVGTVSLLAYSSSTGGALEELTAPDGTTYSKYSDEVYYKAVGVDGDEWSTPDPQQDIQFRMWKANGGEGTLEDWLSKGKPEHNEISKVREKPKTWILPQNGEWSDINNPGNSNFIPNDPESLGLSKGDVVSFKDGYPDFSPYKVENSYSVEGIVGEHSIDMPLIRKEFARVKGFIKKNGMPNETEARIWLKNN